MRVIVAILAGGRGERLWPTSRRRLPKQFLRIIGQESFLQQAYQRACLLASPCDILVATGEDHVALVSEQLPDLPPDRIVAEPVSRDTAASVALAAAFADRIGPGPKVLVCMPADQVIFEQRRFVEAMALAITVATSEACPVLLGVPPTRPETNYGYIERGEALRDGAFTVRRFHEKPDLTRASEYLAAGNFLWNSGMFVCRTDTLRQALETHLPALARAVADLDPHASRDTILAAMEALPRVSLDYGLLERMERVLVVPAAMAWDDVGNWDALLRLHPRDDGGNVLRGRVVASETYDSVVYGSADGRLIVTHGVRDMVVVDTADSTLVVHRQALAGIRQALEAVRAQGHGDYLEAAASLEAALPSEAGPDDPATVALGVLHWSDGPERTSVLRLAAGGQWWLPRDTARLCLLRGTGHLSHGLETRAMAAGEECAVPLASASGFRFKADTGALVLLDFRSEAPSPPRA